MLAEVIQPPWGSDFTESVDGILLPSMTHEMSAGGLLRSVLQNMVITSPADASLGPSITALPGETVRRKGQNVGIEYIINFNVESFMEVLSGFNEFSFEHVKQTLLLQ